LKERDDTIAELKRTLEEKDKTIDALKDQIAKHEKCEQDD
jgi:predicted RNase H-like nuclease (RuvC/YqgF family)